ncbi:MAG: AMMECR1 domain-containing protein [Planctomycetota bacterium]
MDTLRTTKWALVGLVLAVCGAVAVALGLVFFAHEEELPRPPPAEPTWQQRIDRALDRGFDRLEAGIELTAEDKRFLLDAARRVLENHFAARPRKLTAADWADVPENVASQEGTVFVTLVAAGRTRGCMGGRTGHLLERTIEGTKRAIGDARFGGPLRRAELPETRVDITILLEPEPVIGRTLPEIAEEIEPGIHGFRLQRGGRGAYFKNTVVVAHGYSLEHALQRLGVKAGLGPNAYRHPDTTILQYDTVHFAESPVDGSPVAVYRYNILYPQTAVTGEAVAKALRACGEYMANHVDEQGRMTYEYDVYTDRRALAHSPAGLTRVLASTWVLASVARHCDDARMLDAAKRSAEHVLASYYRTDAEGGFGYVQFADSANLATGAFLLLCLNAIGGDFQAQRRAELTRFILAMEDEAKGRLNVAHIYPPDVEGEQARRDYVAGKEAYYPGEALTAMMEVFRRTGDRECLALVERVFPYYRDLYDRIEKQASYTPWMSKPYAAAYFATGKLEYARFVLKMNDNVLDRQRGPEAKYADAIGSFFSAGHVCSSGVMLEGMAEAYRLAVALGDEQRAARYRRSILLGLRFLLQSQYRPENLFTAPNPRLTLGGIRTALGDSSVRIDALQHGAAAFQKALGTVWAE